MPTTVNNSPLMLDIKRMAVWDGPGIRTCFFVKGCPLKCIWCHNPESQSKDQQIARFQHLCQHCGKCRMEEAICPTRAFKIYGKKISIDDLVAKALEDKAFYDESGGGVTISGGEPLFFPEWTTEFLRRMKEAGLHTCLDTTLFASDEVIEMVRPYVDMWLPDFKVFDDAKHIELTGVSNAPIKRNLEELAAAGAEMEIRMIVVPGCNDGEDLEARHRYLDGIGISRESRVELEYHDYARSKYLALGMTDTMPVI